MPKLTKQVAKSVDQAEAASGSFLLPEGRYAALSDSQSFMLGEKGIINLLSQLKLDYDQADADEVYALAVAGYEQEG